MLEAARAALAHPAAPAVTAAAAALLLVPAAMWGARRYGFVAHPKADRWHQRPTVLMGGIGMYLAASLAWFVAPGAGPEVLAIWVAATLMFATGLVDDVRDISPATKLVAQLAAGSLLFYGGFQLDIGGIQWLSFPVTLFWVVAVTNAVNLLDNMDGLAAGVSAIAAASLGVLAALQGDASTAAMAWGLAGAAAGFLVYNFNPARVFMGDCGSLFLGFSVAALALAVPVGGPAPGLALVLLVPAAVMAVPIFDTTLVTVKRLLSGRRISEGGRDHSSHRLVWLGLSERRAVLTLYAVSASFGGLALAFTVLDIFLFYPLLALAAIALAIFGVFLADVKVYEPEVEERAALRLSGRAKADGVLLNVVFRNKQQVAGVAVDVVLVVSSLVIAYYLRYDLAIPVTAHDTLVIGLPIVVAVKLTTFFAMGMYRRMWRYTGSHEIVAVVRASTLASLLTIVALVFFHRFEHFSRSLFVIDWIVTTVALVGARGALRGLRGYFTGHRRSGARALLYGAGDGGFLAVRELLGNHGYQLVPIGFLDDDPSKQRLHMQGLPVVGAAEDLPRLWERLGVEAVILTARNLDDERRAFIRGQCEATGISLLEMDVSFSPVAEQGARPTLVRLDKQAPTTGAGPAAAGARGVAGPA